MMTKKVTEAEKAVFQERIHDYKSALEELKQKVADEEKVLRAVEDEAEVLLGKIRIADFSIKAVSYLCGMSVLSLHMLHYKNENYLNDARKHIYKALLMLEEVFGKHLDEPLNENDSAHELVSPHISDKWKLEFARLFGYAIDYLKDCYGENTKWKWSFVEVEGRYAVVLKNLVDFKQFIKKLDPRIEGYPERNELMKLVKKLLAESAEQFRTKYELTEQRVDDMRYALGMVGVLRRIHQYLGEAEEAAEKKRNYELWRKKLDDDIERREKGRPQ